MSKILFNLLYFYGVNTVISSSFQRASDPDHFSRTLLLLSESLTMRCCYQRIDYIRLERRHKVLLLIPLVKSWFCCCDLETFIQSRVRIRPRNGSIIVHEGELNWIGHKTRHDELGFESEWWQDEFILIFISKTQQQQQHVYKLQISLVSI